MLKKLRKIAIYKNRWETLEISRKKTLKKNKKIKNKNKKLNIF